MSNRVRVLANIEGAYYAGGALSRVLAKYLPLGTRIPPELKGWKKVQWMMEKALFAKKQLWILREPRRVGWERSRYIKFCRATGVGKDLRKKQIDIYPVAEGNPFTRGTSTWREYNRIQHERDRQAGAIARERPTRSAEPTVSNPVPEPSVSWVEVDHRGNPVAASQPATTSYRWDYGATSADNIFLRPSERISMDQVYGGARSGRISSSDFGSIAAPGGQTPGEVQRGVVEARERGVDELDERLDLSNDF